MGERADLAELDGLAPVGSARRRARGAARRCVRTVRGCPRPAGRRARGTLESSSCLSGAVGADGRHVCSQLQPLAAQQRGLAGRARDHDVRGVHRFLDGCGDLVRPTGRQARPRPQVVDAGRRVLRVAAPYAHGRESRADDGERVELVPRLRAGPDHGHRPDLLRRKVLGRDASGRAGAQVRDVALVEQERGRRPRLARRRPRPCRRSWEARAPRCGGSPTRPSPRSTASRGGTRPSRGSPPSAPGRPGGSRRAPARSPLE